MLQEITSSQNSLVKEARSLKIKKHRDAKGLFLIEGEKLVKEAINEKAEIIRIFVSKRYIKEKSCNLFMEDKTLVLNDKLFKEVSDTETPQGIIAVVKQRKYDLENILGKNNYIIILDEIQDPGNMGTIIRTADAAGFTGIIASRGCVDVFSPKVIRSTMGSIFRIPVCTGADITESIDRLKKEGMRVYASHLDGKVSIHDIDMKNSIAVIIGNESKGVSPEASLKADSLITIPMFGKAESLNASVAAGILMYECVRQRLKRSI